MFKKIKIEDIWRPHPSAKILTSPDAATARGLAKDSSVYCGNSVRDSVRDSRETI